MWRRLRKSRWTRTARRACIASSRRSIAASRSNPDGIAQQVEGAIVYGLSAALKEAITIKGGAVEQSNFHDFELLRIDEMPVVEVHIIPSTESPSGTGEPGLPPTAPAVANAIFAATGKRLRTLPFKV